MTDPTSTQGAASSAAPAHQDVRAAVSAWESLLRAQVALMRRFMRDDIWTTVGIREYDVLFTLASRGGMRLNQLNEEILLTQPSLSRMVDRLVARGLVTKNPVADDRRGTWIELSEAGRAVQQHIGRAHGGRIARYVGQALDGQELAQLERLTTKLRLAQDEIDSDQQARTLNTTGATRGTQPPPATDCADGGSFSD